MVGTSSLPLGGHRPPTVASDVPDRFARGRGAAAPKHTVARVVESRAPRLPRRTLPDPNNRHTAGGVGRRRRAPRSPSAIATGGGVRASFAAAALPEEVVSARRSASARCQRSQRRIVTGARSEHRTYRRRSTRRRWLDRHLRKTRARRRDSRSSLGQPRPIGGGRRSGRSIGCWQSRSTAPAQPAQVRRRPRFQDARRGSGSVSRSSATEGQRTLRTIAAVSAVQ